MYFCGAGEIFEGTGIELNQQQYHEATDEVDGRYHCMRLLFSHSVRLLLAYVWANVRPLLGYCWATATSQCWDNNRLLQRRYCRPFDRLLLVYRRYTVKRLQEAIELNMVVSYSAMLG